MVRAQELSINNSPPFNNSLLFLSEVREVGIGETTCSQSSMIGFPLRNLCGVVDTELEWEEDSSAGEVISAILVTPTHYIIPFSSRLVSSLFRVLTSRSLRLSSLKYSIIHLVVVMLVKVPLDLTEEWIALFTALLRQCCNIHVLLVNKRNKCIQ